MIQPGTPLAVAISASLRETMSHHSIANPRACHGDSSPPRGGHVSPWTQAGQAGRSRESSVIRPLAYHVSLITGVPPPPAIAVLNNIEKLKSAPTSQPPATPTP
jgi:hypothetical protein